MTKEEFIRRANEIKESWVDSRFEKYLNYIVDDGIVDLEKVPENYKAVYPAIAAYLEKVAFECINGAAYEKDRVRERKEANNIKKRFSLNMIW